MKAVCGRVRIDTRQEGDGGRYTLGIVPVTLAEQVLLFNGCSMRAITGRNK